MEEEILANPDISAEFRTFEETCFRKLRSRSGLSQFGVKRSIDNGRCDTLVCHE